jgi:hypothetical protein
MIGRNVMLACANEVLAMWAITVILMLAACLLIAFYRRKRSVASGAPWEKNIAPEVVGTAFPDTGISFGDNVRVKTTALTEKLGVAGLSGHVFGQTIPSSSGVDDIISEAPVDYAINVYFDDRKEGFWFAEPLLELVDHGAGSEVRLDGIPKRWVRTTNGEWEELDVSPDKS